MIMGQKNGRSRKQRDAASDDSAGFFLSARTDPVAHIDRQPHGKSRDYDGQRVHDLASGGNGGDIHIRQLTAELTDDQQVNRSVHRL